MVDHLNFPVEIIPCPTVREEDGLAKSSRNVYLSNEERKQAPILWQALQKAAHWIKSEPGLTPQALKQRMLADLSTADLAKVDYVEIVSYPSLQPITTFDRLEPTKEQIAIAVAAYFGRARLIDNILV